MEFELSPGAELSEAETAALVQVISASGLASTAVAAAAPAWQRAGNEEAVGRGGLIVGQAAHGRRFYTSAAFGFGPGGSDASGYVPPARRSRGATRA